MPVDRSPVKTRSQVEREKKSLRVLEDYPASPTDVGASTSNIPTESHHATHNPPKNPDAVPLHEQEATRAASIRSIKSTEARIRQRKLEAEESLANIRRDQLELQALLIKKRLAVDVAAIRDETDRESIAAEEVETSQRINDWLQQSLPRGELREHNHGQTRERETDHSPIRRKEMDQPTVTFEQMRRQRSPTPTRSRDRGIDRLAEVLERMVRHRAPPRQTQDLPIFSGAVGEWLPFKAAVRESTRLHGFSPAENLARMRACLKGEARQTVSALLYAATDPSQIMSTLEQCYGRPEMIIDHALEDMRRLPKLTPNTTAAELNSFAIKLQNIVIIIDSIDERGYLQNPMLARNVTEKLTPLIRSRWCDYVEEKGTRSEPEILTLSKFLMREAERSMRHTYTTATATAASQGNKTGMTSASNAKVTNQRKGMNVYATTESQSKKTECLACGSEHDTPKCNKLAAMTVPKRWEWAKETRICFQCLNSKHRRFKCKSKRCGVDECKQPHHALLHSPRENASKSESTREETVITASTHFSGSQNQVLLKVCPITVKGNNGKEVNTYALLDEGSTITLIDDEIAAIVGARGPLRPLRIHGVTSSQQEPESRVVDLQIRGRTQDSYHSIKARTVKNLVLGSQSVDNDLLKHVHLQELMHENVCYAHGKPRILIGADNWHLIVTRKLLIGTKSQPAASLTQLGWIIHGSTPRSVITQEESVLHVRTIQKLVRSESDALIHNSHDDLSELVKTHFDLDALGISQKRKPIEKEERAMEIFDRTVKRVNGRFEVGLPWRTDDVTLPPSYDMAVSRLRGIEKKLDKNPQLRDAYTDQMNKLLEKGYAIRCEEDHTDHPRLWYLPHFAVINPNKPGKVRIVFDAAAKVNGTSLNDELLDGPDLLKALHGILLRFRMKPVAVVADIREMFLRVKIRSEDCVAQHFLWRGDDRNTIPQKYMMTSMIFGARSSPFIAHSVRDRNATEFKDTHPLAYHAILENHYMDDWVDSFESKEMATHAIEEVRDVHSRACFFMAGWMSNVPEPLETIPEDDRASTPRELGTSMQGKTLGLIWIPDKDELAFNTDMHRVPQEVKDGKRTPTKREVLGAVMSLYDPLGLVSPYTISAKIMLQGLWKIQLEWDDILPMEETMEFADWLKDLEFIKRLRLPRCYEKNDIVERELHVFCDASDQAYACAVYWRFVMKDASVKVILITGKAKVASIKPQSIPRMELQAALIGARLVTGTLKELNITPDTQVTLWSDSKTVIHWIRNDSVRYTPFVTHRLSEIAELTAVEQWRWLPSTQNVADDATRQGKTKLRSEDRWFTGPTFLYEQKGNWPRESSTCQDYDDVEVNRTEEESPWITMTRFSKYERLVRTVGYVLLFIDKCRRRERELTSRHLKEAESLLIKQGQRESFASERERLEKGKVVERSSRLRKLDPILGSDGIIRLNGRIRAAAVPEERKYPPILDGAHHLTKLIIRREHEQNSHVGRETIVNNVRQRYWVLRLRPAVRKILNDCVTCRTRKAKPSIPIKGDLPEIRLSAYTRPFSRCGVDCFGPMIITIGRRREKRWGMIFTCLVTRGIHIETLSSLSTDSAIMAMRRMAARRGWPQLYYSDNGTNFHGADVELCKANKEWLPELKNYVMMKRAEWRYIDPGAPNQGGAWERMIRTVKTALSSVMKERAPKEEILNTLMAEVEYTVNSRPLLHVPVSPEDEEALTPNHFLLGTSDGMPYVGECELADKRTWKTAQALANMFWARWIKEYLPTIVPRGEARSDKLKNIKEGELVIIADGLLPRNLWPRGQVTRVHPGKDGVVRSVEVRTRGGIFRRPVRRLIVLPSNEEAS